MNRWTYYEEMKALARKTRSESGIVGYRVMKKDMRRIYKSNGIAIDYWPHKLRGLRGAYFSDECGTSVMIAKGLPLDPLIFTMAHELKHHLVDRDTGLSYCDSSNESEPMEIGAEIFAAEFIFPEQEFVDILAKMGVHKNECTPEVLVRLKQETKTTLSYAGLSKRAVFLGLASSNSMKKVHWRKIETELYGEPIYKQIQRLRQKSRN